MYNHLTPEYLSSLIPQQVNEIAHYNLRNSNNIQTIRAKTNQYNNSFLPSVLRDWNTLPAEAKQLNTVSSFKYFLKKENKPVPKYYYYGKRNTQTMQYVAVLTRVDMHLDQSEDVIYRLYNKWLYHMTSRLGVK